MGKITKIIDYQFRKMRESIAKEREEMIQRHDKQMKETEEVLQRIRDNRATFERHWFKLLEGGK